MALTKIPSELSSTTGIVDNSNSTAITIDSSENVGIGTSSPVARLEVHGAFPFSGTVTSLSTSVTKASARIRGSSDASTSLYFGSLGNDAEQYIQSSNDSGTGADDIALNPYGGKVGIGTSSPATTLNVKSSSYPYVRVTNDGYTGLDIGQADSGESGAGLIKLRDSAPLLFYTGDLERMRIDSSGNLLIGKTTTGVAGAGIVLRGGGELFVTRAGDVMNLNRLSTDGEILAFRKDGTTVGSIGTSFNSGGRYFYISGLSASGVGFWSSGIYPSSSTGGFADNSKNLGSSSVRWDNVYATNGTIQTSDRNEKQDIAELSDAEQRVAVACKGLLRKFRWKDSVAEKGDDARIHFGIIAQDLQAAFEAEGLDAGDYAMFISTTWTDEETNEEKTRMGVRYSELLAFIISAI